MIIGFRLTGASGQVKPHAFLHACNVGNAKMWQGLGHLVVPTILEAVKEKTSSDGIRTLL